MVKLSKNAFIIIKPSDPNLGLVILEILWYETECFRQLKGSTVYQELCKEEAKISCLKAKIQLQEIMDTFSKNLQYKEQEFFNSKLDDFEIPGFYITHKIQKTPMVGRPIVAGYNWLAAPVSKVVHNI